MPGYTEKAELQSLPVIAMRDIAAFPGIPINFEISRAKSIAALEAAKTNGMSLFLVMQRDASVEEPKKDDIYTTGTVVTVKQSVKNSSGVVRVIAEGQCRASLTEINTDGDYITGTVMCKTIVSDMTADIRMEALMRSAIKGAENLLNYVPGISGDFLIAAKSLKAPGLLADFIAATLLIKPEDRQRVLDIYDPRTRLEQLLIIIEDEVELMQVEMTVSRKVRSNIDRNQRDYFLREQLKVIEDELDQDGDSESAEYSDKIDALEKGGVPDEIISKLRKEVSRLDKMQFGSPESSVIRGYLDVCLELPWIKTTKDRLDIEAARKVLDADHDGLVKVKERILEFLAVKQFNPDIKNQILCFVGPPGVGKTSVASSIARALKRKFVRVSLGGVRDESDIRGHRKTYIGAMPGRIITALSQCGSRNPVILLDEVDKMCRDAHGDPASALLEVLDSEQNKAFRDHFIELPIDLSECMFITTANTLSTISAPLLDRMEIIELHTYTRFEKLSIAKNHLIPKQLKRHGLNKRMLKLTDDAVLSIIDSYTSESGVRNLERELANIMRKATMRLCGNSELKTIKVDADNLHEFLGVIKFEAEKLSPDNETGVVNGMAYTEAGGDLLKIEAAVMNGSGKLELTGTLGDVMKESAHIAMSYIRAHHDELGIDDDFHIKKDIHIHVPEGAVPKDGPSAGVTITTALVSILSSTPVRRDVSMTGEITLTGRVLAIGGLREKTTAAYAAGIRTILIPKDNVKDLEEIDPLVRENVTFIPCSKISDVLDAALVRTEAAACDSAPLKLPAVTDKHRQNKNAVMDISEAKLPDSVPTYNPTPVV